ncbi:MAG: (Fe-S)-binding protein [Thermoplasmata archaeon]
MMAEAVVELDDELWQKVYEITAGAMNPCFQCGTCTASCPLLSYLDRPLSARRILRRAQLGLEGGMEDIWMCSACRSCEVRCPRDVHIVEAIMGLRALAFKARTVPREMNKLLWSTLEEGNPWNDPRSERARWAEGLKVRDAAEGVSVLLYVGCAGSYDPRLQGVARGLMQVLNQAGVEVGILGSRERCCGDAVRVTGERGYLQGLVEENVKTFEGTGANTIVAISPHCFDMFRNLYPRYGLEAEVLHYTEYLEHMLDKGILKPAKVKGSRVAYHDPCYLGRYNGIFEPPRKLLESVPGLELEELRDNRLNALCCGGGGGGMWREEGGERLSDKRMEQVKEADIPLLATSCPYCIQNFEDSTHRMQGARVVDVMELLAPTKAVRG